MNYSEFEGPMIELGNYKDEVFAPKILNDKRSQGRAQIHVGGEM